MPGPGPLLTGISRVRVGVGPIWAVIKRERDRVGVRVNVRGH